MSLFGHKRSSGRSDGYDYWITATELMSAVMLIFLLIGLVALLRAKDEEQEAAACEAKLAICIEQTTECADAALELASCRADLAVVTEERDSCEAAREGCRIELDALKSSTQECSKLQSQREEIDRAIRAFLKKMGLDVDGAAGVVRIDAELLFETGSDLLKDQGRKKLNEIMPAYANAVMQPSVRGAVRRVLIEGHSSRVGGDVFNMRLSALRALAIYEHLRTRLPPFADKEEFLELLTPAGRGELDSKGGPDSDLQEDRSVELRIEFNLPDPVTVPVDQLPAVPQ
jgi:outer membrane protein OmpA-like peptidoglycan-associated protein